MGCCQAKAFDPLAVAEEDRTPSQEPAAAVASPAGVQVVEEAAPQEEEEPSPELLCEWVSAVFGLVVVVGSQQVTYF